MGLRLCIIAFVEEFIDNTASASECGKTRMNLKPVLERHYTIFALLIGRFQKWKGIVSLFCHLNTFLSSLQMMPYIIEIAT